MDGCIQDVDTDKTTETGWIYGMPAAVVCADMGIRNWSKSWKRILSNLKIFVFLWSAMQRLCVGGGVNIVTVDKIDEIGIFSLKIKRLQFCNMMEVRIMKLM